MTNSSQGGKGICQERKALAYTRKAHGPHEQQRFGNLSWRAIHNLAMPTIKQEDSDSVPASLLPPIRTPSDELTLRHLKGFYTPRISFICTSIVSAMSRPLFNPVGLPPSSHIRAILFPSTFFTPSTTLSTASEVFVVSHNLISMPIALERPHTVAHQFLANSSEQDHATSSKLRY